MLSAPVAEIRSDNSPTRWALVKNRFGYGPQNRAVHARANAGSRPAGTVDLSTPLLIVNADSLRFNINHDRLASLRPSDHTRRIRGPAFGESCLPPFIKSREGDKTVVTT